MSNGNVKQEAIEDTYDTKDLHFAAFLQIKGLVIHKLEQHGRGMGNQNPVYFVFFNRDRCQELEEMFWGGSVEELMVNVKEYFTAIRDLRSRMFAITKLVRQEESSFGRESGR